MRKYILSILYSLISIQMILYVSSETAPFSDFPCVPMSDGSCIIAGETDEGEVYGVLRALGDMYSLKFNWTFNTSVVPTDPNQFASRLASIWFNAACDKFVWSISYYLSTYHAGDLGPMASYVCNGDLSMRLITSMNQKIDPKDELSYAWWSTFAPPAVQILDEWTADNVAMFPLAWPDDSLLRTQPFWTPSSTKKTINMTPPVRQLCTTPYVSRGVMFNFVEAGPCLSQTSTQIMMQVEIQFSDTIYGGNKGGPFKRSKSEHETVGVSQHNSLESNSTSALIGG